MEKTPMAQSQSFPTAFHDPVDPDHHLWRNGHRWWIAFTVHLPGWQKERVRFSLGTADLSEARARRDQVLREYPQARGCELSLRLDGRRGSGGCGAYRGMPARGSEGHAA
jgi:hypothetical protein